MNRPYSKTEQRRNGFALVMVMILMALLIILVIGMLSLSRDSLESSHYYTTTVRNRQLAESATSLVISQIRKGTLRDPEGNTIWASQPGALRRYDDSGRFHSGFKLYSDGELVVDGAAKEEELAQDSPPVDWEEMPEHYVDLNAAVIRSDPDGLRKVHFPILDPRAASETDAVEGFSYDENFPGAVEVGDEDSWRLPMPVQWIYVLENGTMGTLDEQGDFQPREKVSERNPIVGRIAFWADDETSKININTASEPTFFNTPFTGHEDDYRWAISQPAEGEYQRFPGHPATTALSPVLYPNRTLTADEKGMIYDLVPKLSHTGTKAGTVDIYTNPDPYDRNEALAEHLFATVDEFFLSPDRRASDFDFSGAGNPEASAKLLARSRAFLTAHSRAPETTLFGTPRIAMWPIHRRTDGYRTAFDNLIAFCGTLGNLEGENNNSYFFRRENNDSTTNDLLIPRNQSLLDYLSALTDRKIPGFGGKITNTLEEDRQQVLVQMFDYVRCTNLYEERLENPDTWPNINGTPPQVYDYLPSDQKTFTEGRYRSQSGYHNQGFGFYPGYGQVAPSHHAGWDAQGFGRYYSINEVALHFICCADGTANQYNNYKDSTTISDPWRGGGAAPEAGQKDMTVDPPVMNDSSRRFYSNFPPNPVGDPYGPRNEDPPHPGYDPVNWNWCLESNEPLPPGRKRIQSTFFIDHYCAMAGYTIIRSHVGIRVRGLHHLTIDDQQLYPEDEVEIEPHYDVADLYHHGYRGGFDGGARGLMIDRRLPARGNKKADNGYGSSRRDYDLISNFIDVEGPTMTLKATGPIEIELYDPEAPPGESLVQTIKVQFPDDRTLLPTPNLVTRSGARHVTVDHNGNRRAHEGPRPPFFWSYYTDGYNNGASDIWLGGKGRFHGGRNIPSWGGHGQHGPHWGAMMSYHDPRTSGGNDVVCSMIPWHGDYRLVAGRKIVSTDPGSPYTSRGEGWIFAPHSQYPDVNAQKFGAISPVGRFQFYWPNSWLYHATHKLGGINWASNRKPHFPDRELAMEASRRFGDFDEASGTLVNGPFINKPDEGSLYRDSAGGSYFGRDWMYAESNRNYFSPNRMIPSPGMFGSLPRGVKRHQPWETLLFRANIVNEVHETHPGAEPTAPDHLLLDLFWMPVVEPYAISEPFSTAGKINLNYQMLPFRHIRRATGLHALLKEEKVIAIPTGDAAWSVNGNRLEAHGFFWNRDVDVQSTLRDFDEKFESDNTLFRSASQICEMHLVPEVEPSSRSADPAVFRDENESNQARMNDFWMAHRATGDNLRERPYTNLYSRLTTQTNTWRVHYRVQTLKKSRESKVDQFNPDIDLVIGEERGSVIVERYIDPRDPDLPNYGASSDLSSLPSLDEFYRFRIVNAQTFAP